MVKLLKISIFTRIIRLFFLSLAIIFILVTSVLAWNRLGYLNLFDVILTSINIVYLHASANTLNNYMYSATGIVLTIAYMINDFLLWS